MEKFRNLNFPTSAIWMYNAPWKWNQYHFYFFTWCTVEEVKPSEVTWLEYSLHSVVVQVILKTDPALGIRWKSHRWDSAEAPAVPVTLLLSQACNMNCHNVHLVRDVFSFCCCASKNPVKFRYEWQQPRYRVVNENSRGLWTELVSTLFSASFPHSSSQKCEKQENV